MTGTRDYRRIITAVLAVFWQLAVLATLAGAQTTSGDSFISISSIPPDAETATKRSPPYFSQTTSTQTTAAQSNTATSITAHIENTEMKVASSISIPTTSHQSNALDSLQAALASASTGIGQAQETSEDECTRVFLRDKPAGVACFSFEPLTGTEEDTTSTSLSSLSQQASPSMLSTTSSQTPDTSTSDDGSSASVPAPSSFKTVQVTITKTLSRNATSTASRLSASGASPSQTDGDTMNPSAGRSEPTTLQNATPTAYIPGSTDDDMAPVSEMPSLALDVTQDSRSPDGYGGANATMLPGVLETVTYTTTICPSGARD